MRKFLLLFLFHAGIAFSQSYAPAAGLPGSTAIFKNSPLFVGWATGINVTRGYVNLSNPAATAGGSNFASSGLPVDALGFPDTNTVSLGDGGVATVTFAAPIIDGPGFDFAVFENGGTTYLELGFVEVSSDGSHFFRFPAHSQTQTVTQIGSFGTPSATYLNNLAGKYSAEYGTPFDLAELPNDALLDKNNITHVKIIDVVGSINPDFASYDSFGNAVNDSFPTPFVSGGFDLQAVGVINQLDLGTNDFANPAALFLYPNPAKDHIYLSADFDVTVRIVDLSGRIVLGGLVVNHEGINISELNPGMYLVETASGRKSQILPLIVK